MEQLGWQCHWTITKYDADAVRWATHRLGHEPDGTELAILTRPYEVVEIEGNLLVTVGLNRITALIIGASTGTLGNTATRIGVGNGAGTAAVGDTDLSAAAGSTNRYFQPMDSTFPQQSNGVLSFQSTFASANGNFAWNEYGIDVGTPTVTGGTTVNTLINHKTSIAGGTKASGNAWVASTNITLA